MAKSLRQRAPRPARVAPTAPGDSLEQQDAEGLTIGLLGENLGVTLSKKRFELPAGGWLEIDGYCESPRILCEAWAHVGRTKSAQKFKVMSDAMKLLYAASLGPHSEKRIIVFADEEAASHFIGRSWMAQALKAHGIEIQVVSLPEEIREKIRKAQERQYR